MALTEQEKLAKRRERFASKPEKGHGLVSRGEDGLRRDKKARHEFFSEIKQQVREWTLMKNVTDERPELKPVVSGLVGPFDIQTRNHDVFLNLRKLREAILGIEGDQAFCHDVHVFSYRIGILLNHSQTYGPSLSWLYHKMRQNHQKNSKARDNVEAVAAADQEVQKLYIIHKAMSNMNLGYKMLSEARLTNDEYLNLFMRGVTTGDLMSMNNAWQQGTNVYVKCLMQANSIRKPEEVTRFLHVMGKSYFQMELQELERMTGASWQDIQKLVSWSLEGSMVVIRRRKV